MPFAPAIPAPPFVFELATPDDDPAIRKLLAAAPMPGAVRLTYEREPNYFTGCRTLGSFCQLLVARDTVSGELAGLASRTIRPRFVNGQIEYVGYLSQLRVAPSQRGRWLVSQGFRTLHELHRDGRAQLYLASITDENRTALGLLVNRPRRHFPSFREVARIYTAAIILRRRGTRPRAGVMLRRATATDIGPLVEFLNRTGRTKQFTPYYTADDFGSAATQAFQLADLVLAYQDGALVGALGLWDQSSYKQLVVQGYTGAMRWARTPANLALRLFGAQPLAAPGQAIRSVYASFASVVENDSEVFAALLDEVYRIAAHRGYAYLMIGFAKNDPLLATVRRYAHVPYHSRLYSVCWEDGAPLYERIDDRIAHVDIATL